MQTYPPIGDAFLVSLNRYHSDLQMSIQSTSSPNVTLDRLDHGFAGLRERLLATGFRPSLEKTVALGNIYLHHATCY
jgi:hypothetical protein